MSRAEALRGLVTEKLAAASREIFAAVDRIVAEYEEEASGFREEIDRQKKQLEVLQQPQLQLLRADVRSSRRLEEEEEEEEEDEESPEDFAEKSPLRSRAQLKRRRPGRPQNQIHLRIRILKDPQTRVLSNITLKQCPLLKLSCPPHLQETDFLDLLRSSSPHLLGDGSHFDILTSDKRRRLRPVTAEEILRHTGSSERKLLVYIRLKEAEEEAAQPHRGDGPLQTESGCERPASTSTMSTRGDTELQTSSAQEVLHRLTSHQHDLETEDVTRQGCEPRSAAHGKTEEEEERGPAADSDDNWKPEKDEEEFRGSGSELPKTSRKLKSRTGRGLVCQVCGAAQTSEVDLVKHSWGHAEDPRSLCGACGELLDSVEALKEHLSRRHSTEDCPICGDAIIGALHLQEHVATHSGEMPYQCDLCPDRFALMASLQNHRKLHAAAAKQHKCHTCSQVFQLRSQLKAHRATHTHLCGVCGKSLSDYRSLSRHKMTHTGERPHRCTVCGRGFKLLGTLRQHEKIHTDRERTYLCDVCCKMFLTSKQLQIHMRTHTNEKPYHCGECGKGFTTKGPLTIHMRVHTGETPYRCPDCGWSFKRKVHLDNHVTVHSDLKPFVCGVCGKACARKVYLKVHMRTHNGERPYRCTLCDKAFTQSHCLKTHMKSHLAADVVT